ncbi:unnamed protein product [Cladocopium goreaui]|uniref:JmjC domain-containing protein n=1 Tax=Cladocopium goreaui TaxID=2562237 RepID=A0A9P1GKT7_9DINO|nr:unnamed protein product [Cladocopium goreaui]
MGCCKKFCCCLWCPCCFCLGTLRAFALLGAFLALLVALALGPVPVDIADDIGDLCEAVAWFRDTELSYTVASTENLQAWAEGCHAAFHQLQPEAQELLRNLQKTGRHRSEEVLREHGIEERTELWKWKTNRAVDNGTLIPETSPPFVDLSEIRQAFHDARVVRFDATKLLPKHMFNATLQDIERLHQKTIDETILYGTLGGGGLCRMFLLMPVSNLYPRLGRTMLFSALRLGLMAFQQLVCRLKPLPFWIENPERRKFLGSANINLKRLPNFGGTLDVPSRLGLKEDVAGMLALLWMGMVTEGPARSSFHTDVQDNILMELVSETVVMVVPRELFWQKPSNEEVSGTYFKVNLKPGEGIVIPSNYLHSVQHLHADRLGVNFFFEPRFGSMQWPNSSGNFYAETAKERKEHLAMRSLWFQSANEVWNKFGKGVPFHGWKMEIL